MAATFRRPGFATISPIRLRRVNSVQKNCLSLLDKHVNALNLLLTALQWYESEVIDAWQLLLTGSQSNDFQAAECSEIEGEPSSL